MILEDIKEVVAIDVEFEEKDIEIIEKVRTIVELLLNTMDAHELEFLAYFFKENKKDYQGTYDDLAKLHDGLENLKSLIGLYRD